MLLCHHEIKYRVYYYVRVRICAAEGWPCRKRDIRFWVECSKGGDKGAFIKHRLYAAAVLSFEFVMSNALDARWGIRLLYYSRNFYPLRFLFAFRQKAVGKVQTVIQHLIFLLSYLKLGIVCLYYFILLLIFFSFFFYRKSPLFTSRTPRWFQFSHIIRKVSRQVFR